MRFQAHFRKDTPYYAAFGSFYSFPVRFIFFLVLFSFFVIPDAHPQKKSQPTIEVAFPNYSYPRTLTSLRQLDLKNSDAFIFGDGDTPDLRAHLHRGTYEKLHEIGGDRLDFWWVKYIGNGSAQADYAVVYYVWLVWAGSSSPSGVVQLLRIEDNHLKVEQQIFFNVRSEKAGAFFNSKSNVLTIRGVNGWEHCCPTRLDVAQFQLKDGVLKQMSHRTVPFA